MPKHKHTRDKLYYTQEEMRLKYFQNKKKENTYYFLPFNYCCVSLRPLNTCKNICCDRDGNIYNKYYLLEYMTKYHRNPVSGRKPFSIKELVNLNIAKDKNGDFICPVTLKPLNSSLKIVAIPETGNVFSNMAYQELNVSMNNYRDLINDKSFEKKNVIVINDPLHKKIVKNFYFQNMEEEKEYMNKLVNNKKEFDRSDNERNILLDNKYKKIVKDVEDNNDEDKNGIKTLKDNNLIYEEENEDIKEKNKDDIEGYDDYLLLREKIKVIISLIRQKGLTNNNIYSSNLDEDLYKSMLDFNYEGFYCFMVKEKLWEKYFKFTDLNSITHSDKLKKNNNMSITSTFFQAREDKNINKKDGIPLFSELKDIYFPLIKKNQLKTYMILTTNLSVLSLELWSTRMTETVEKIYNIISSSLSRIKTLKLTKVLDDEFLIIEDLKIDIKIEKDKKIKVDKNVIKGPYIGYMTNLKRICFFTNKNKYINKTDIYIIGTVFDKEEKENILDEYFDSLKTNADNEINIIKLELINNPFLDAMKDILFQEIKEKYLSQINNNEINDDIKIMRQLEKQKDNEHSSVGKYINKKRANNVDYETFKKFLNNEC